MDNSIVLHKTFQFNAPVAKVWDALTNPEKIKQYLFGTQTITDWKEGSPIIWTGTWEGKEYKDKGTVLKCEKEKVLKYSYWSGFSGTPDVPENYTFLTFELSPKDGGTNLSFMQEGFHSQEGYDHSDANWTMVMDAMKKLVEG
jgi:uncharacterized protein YndB with AHSA1/START domain